MSEATTAKRTGFMIAIMALFFVVPSQGAAISALGDIGAAFPDVSSANLGYVSTIVSVGQIISALVATALVSRQKASFKALFTVATVIFIIAGTCPYFIPDGMANGFAVLLVTRFVFGLGLGMLQPLLNTVVTLVYSDEKQRSSTIGFGNAFFNAGSVVTQMLGGFLCVISWQTTFLTYLVGIIPLICVIALFKEPEHQGNLDAAKKEKFHLPGVVWVYLILFVGQMILWYPLAVYGSVFLGEGHSALAGTLGSFFTLMGIPAALVFGLLYKKIGKWSLPIGNIVVVIALVAGYLAFRNSEPVLGLAWVAYGCIGIGQTWHGAAFTMRIGKIVNPATVAMALGLMSSLMNFGGFLSTPIDNAISAAWGLPATLLVGSIGVIVVVILFAVLNKTVPEIDEGEEEKTAA